MQKNDTVEEKPSLASISNVLADGGAYIKNFKGRFSSTNNDKEKCTEISKEAAGFKGIIFEVDRVL
eukprot:Pgem_evm1s16204